MNMDISIECDKFPRNGETLFGKNFIMNAGGKGGNQAVASVRYGASTYMIGSVGQDFFGDRLLEEMNKYNVNYSYVSHSQNNETGTAIIIRHNSDNRILLSPGANLDVNLDGFERVLKTHSKHNDYVLAQLEIPYEIVKQAFSLAKKMQLTTILNAAPALQLDNKFLSMTDILIMNQTECEVVTGIFPNTDNDLEEIALFFKDVATKVIITLASQGCVTIIGNCIQKYSAYAVEVTDTTGAGDCFVGVLVAALAKGESLESAISNASLAAAISITRTGAQQAMPTIDEIRRGLR